DRFSILFFAPTGSAHTVVRHFEGKKQAEDPDDFFTKMEDLRERLKDMGENCLGREIRGHHSTGDLQRLRLRSPNQLPRSRL
ncbi:unnamed protein product, partial [Ectocarpus sp. 13 AM-2016]